MVRCSGRIARALFFIVIMTNEAKIKRELEKLYEYRRLALKRNDLIWTLKNDAKIREKEAELERCKMYQPTTLREVLGEYGEDTRNRVYKALLKISLAADFVNECVEEAKDVLKEIDLRDFTLRAEAEELCKLSQKIASFVIMPKQTKLTEMMTDNEKFIDKCLKAADAHLKKTLKL